mmetsp:Transcript_65633/g.207623  ORF Transcript_65633/g.207623 Transcript_65633/m.207623 type:complete len:184 (+) Transcript_65633:264-815(+)
MRLTARAVSPSVLEQEAETLRKEMEDAAAELENLLQQQRGQADELSALRDTVASQVAGLREERWKLEAYADLEAVKDQLGMLGLGGMAALGDPLPGTASTLLDGERDWDADLGAASADMGDMVKLDAELDREMAGIEAQLKAAQQDRLEMEEKRAALKREMEELVAMEAADAAAEAAEAAEAG